MALSAVLTELFVFVSLAMLVFDHYYKDKHSSH